MTSDEAVWQPAYPIPDALRDKVEQELQNMLDAGIIQYDTETSCNSPLIVVRKPDGRIRLVNNFIELNKRTVVECYQMISRVAGAKYVSKIDFTQYFYQISLERDSLHLTGSGRHGVRFRTNG